MSSISYFSVKVSYISAVYDVNQTNYTYLNQHATKNKREQQNFCSSFHFQKSLTSIVVDEVDKLFYTNTVVVLIVIY